MLRLVLSEYLKYVAAQIRIRLDGVVSSE